MQNIKAILGKNQPGLLQTLIKSQEQRECISCGKVFTATTWLRPDGSELPPGSKCRSCVDNERDMEKLHELELQLPESDAKTREWWRVSSGIPELSLEKTFDNFNKERQAIAFNSMHILAWKFGGSLVLSSPGTYGVGKTHLVIALANHVMNTEPAAYILDGLIRRHPNPVYFTTENMMLRRIRNTFDKDSQETEEDVYRAMARVDLLIVDDVGKVRPRDMSFTQSVYFNIIDQRYCDHKPVVMTTNLDFSALEEHIGGACADRLREMCGRAGLVKMSGESYRRTL